MMIEDGEPMREEESPPDFSLPPVQEVVNEILKDKMSRAFYEKKYPSFFKRYPTLSEKIFDPSFDESIVRYMLNQMEKMNRNKQSERDASIKVGSLLVDTFVKPAIKKTAP